MKEKIQLLIKNEGLTQSKLADILEIQPANVSHILSGRSKPGFELLQKILRRFPHLNPDWLLLDKEPMYRPEFDKPTDSKPAGLINQRPAPNLDSLFPGAVNYPSAPDGSAELATNGDAPKDAMTSSQLTARGQVARVVVFYADHTFESFEPKS